MRVTVPEFPHGCTSTFYGRPWPAIKWATRALWLRFVAHWFGFVTATGGRHE